MPGSRTEKQIIVCVCAIALLAMSVLWDAKEHQRTGMLPSGHTSAYTKMPDLPVCKEHHANPNEHRVEAQKSQIYVRRILSFVFLSNHPLKVQQRVRWRDG